VGRGGVEQAVGDRDERGAARRGQPLVRVGRDRVEARRVERQPAGGLRGVDQRQRAGGGRGVGDRVEVGATP